MIFRELKRCCLALEFEDWFDLKRLREDYVPTGFKDYGVKTRAMRGHEFGLQLSAEDKQALTAFLKNCRDRLI